MTNLLTPGEENIRRVERDNSDILEELRQIELKEKLKNKNQKKVEEAKTPNSFPKTNLEKKLKDDSLGKPVLSLKFLYETAVETKSVQEYDTLMQVYELGNWVWKDEALPTDIARRKNYGNCVGAGMDYEEHQLSTFGRDEKSFYLEHNWKVITVQEFYNSQNPPITSEMLNKINEWFEKNKPNRASK